MFDPRTGIALVAFGLAIVSQVLQRTVGKKKEMKERQDKMKEKQARMKELMKREDAKSKNELEALEREVMEELNVMMKGSMRLMMYSMVIFLPTFWWLSGAYADAVISLPVPVPWFGDKAWIQLFNETSWLGWYVLCSLAFSLVLNAVINLYEKHVVKKNG